MNADASPNSAKLVAVVDIGATSVRMAVAEIGQGQQVRTLESLAQAVSLGKDTFVRGSIDPSTTEECVRVLKSYRARLDEYGIRDDSQVHVVATSAVREATNRLAFLKRIYLATGFYVEPFDEAAVSRVTYLGVQPLLASETRLANGKSLVIEVGGGSTEVLLFDGPDVAYANTYRLGALRLRKTLEVYHTPTVKFRNVMEGQIARIVDQVRKHVPRDHTLAMVALGGDVRFAAGQLLEDGEGRSLADLPVARLREFTDRMLGMTVDEVVHRYQLAFPEAEAIGAALLTYVQVAEALGLEQILVSNINLRDGLISEMASRAMWSERFTDQILRSALDLGRRFGFDERHGVHVAHLARTLFRELQDEHGLSYRHEVILYVAALLHDVGYAVNTRSHHKHSYYLINNGELFGLSRRDVLLAALTARYHRRASPKPIHEGYANLDWESQTHVTQMAAILRVADALDRANSQRIRQITCTREPGQFVISVPGAEDLSLEQMTLQQKATLFKELFGRKVLLRNAPDSP